MNLVFNAIFPTFAIVILGFLAKKFNILGENSERVLNNFVYYFAMPAILFVAMANEPISEIVNLPFIYSFALSSIILYLLGFGLSIFFKPKTINTATMRALTISSPNVAYMGIPVLVSLFGEKALLPISIATFLLVLTTLITIFILEVSNHCDSKPLAMIKKLALILITNPLIVAPALGIIFACTSLKLPTFINTFGHQLGSIAGPCALFAIGQTLFGRKMFAEKIEFGLIGIGKLILQPVLMSLFIPIFHLTALYAACGFILSALPCAAITYVVAQQYQVYEQRAAALIFETITFSIITLSLVIRITYHTWPSVFLNH